MAVREHLPGARPEVCTIPFTHIPLLYVNNKIGSLWAKESGLEISEPRESVKFDNIKVEKAILRQHT